MIITSSKYNDCLVNLIITVIVIMILSRAEGRGDVPAGRADTGGAET